MLLAKTVKSDFVLLKKIREQFKIHGRNFKQVNRLMCFGIKFYFHES